MYTLRQRIGRVFRYMPTYIKVIIFLIIAAILCTVFFFFGKNFGGEITEQVTILVDKDPKWEKPDYVTYEPIVKNEYSRPATFLPEVNGIVIHYVANPESTAEQNRSYFQGLSESKITYASSHFIVGLEGEVLQIIPLDEIAYASNDRNSDTIAIECCHPDETGKYNDATYDSAVKLTADLCLEFNLNPAEDVIRHYDVSGKMCPKYFVENEEAWNSFIADVEKKMTE